MDDRAIVKLIPDIFHRLFQKRPLCFVTLPDPWLSLLNPIPPAGISTFERFRYK